MPTLKHRFEARRSALALHGQAEADQRDSFYDGASAAAGIICEAGEENTLDAVKLVLAESVLQLVQRHRARPKRHALDLAIVAVFDAK